MDSNFYLKSLMFNYCQIQYSELKNEFCKQKTQTANRNRKQVLQTLRKLIRYFAHKSIVSCYDYEQVPDIVSVYWVA